MAQKRKQAPRYRHLMYTQFLDHMVLSVEELIAALEQIGADRYALIVHDKDTDKDGNPIGPHVHAMMSFKNGHSLASIAKQFHDKPQYLEIYDKNVNNGYSYLIHATTKARNKYQYDPSEVIANFDYVSLVTVEIPGQIAAKHDKKAGTVKTLLDLMYIGAKTKREVEAELSGSLYGKYRSQIEAVWAKRLQMMAEEWREKKLAEGAQVQVIWIYGPAGTGKTSLAKSYARKAGQGYYISGSSRDIFQGYNGEHTLVMDELRPKTIPYHDLLRILDPFNLTDPTMAPSRYSDKAIACDLIIITTPYNPLSFYQKEFDKESDFSRVDSFNQLLRRLTLVVYMNDDIMEVVTYNFYGFQLVPGTEAPNPYSAKHRPAPKVDRMAIYRDMLGSAAPATDSTPENEITATAVAEPLKSQNEGGGNNDPGEPKEN